MLGDGHYHAKQQTKNIFANHAKILNCIFHLTVNFELGDSYIVFTAKFFLSLTMATTSGCPLAGATIISSPTATIQRRQY